MVDWMEDLVGQAERAVAERLLEQVVGVGDRSDQRVLDRKAAGIGAAFTHQRNDVRDVATGEYLKVGPASAGRRFAEGPV
jgi:hypothetical protein